jgi:hypothetical protein
VSFLISMVVVGSQADRSRQAKAMAIKQAVFFMVNLRIPGTIPD